MQDDFIQMALEQAARSFTELAIEEEELESQQEELQRKQSKLLLKMASLAVLADDIPRTSTVGVMLSRLARLGLTDAIRAVLKVSGDWMTPLQVRDQLIRLRINLDKYKNPLASIHTILGRLSDGDTAPLESKVVNGKTVFRFRVRKPKRLKEILAELPPEKSEEMLANAARNFVIKPRPRKKKLAGKTE